MVEVHLGSKNDSPVQLKKSADLVAVRTRSRRSLRAGPVQPAAAAEVADGQLVLAFPEAGVEVYRVPQAPSKRSLEQRKLGLRRDPDVRFAGGVLVERRGPADAVHREPVHQVRDCGRSGRRPRGFASQGLARSSKRSTYATNAFFAGLPEGSGEKVFDVATELLARADVEYCHPELVRSGSGGRSSLRSGT